MSYEGEDYSEALHKITAAFDRFNESAEMGLEIMRDLLGEVRVARGGAASEPDLGEGEKSQALLCSACGCEGIMVLAWVDANTGAVTNRDAQNDSIWCPDCEAHVTATTDLEPF